jgi:ABC-type Fe3+-hydroxamate transport system substrate-binding protein
LVMIERKDDLSRTIRLETPARRIVSLVPSITETLFALGAGDRVTGITDYCVHPAAEVCLKNRVGGTKNFDIQKVLALTPDLIIANAEENRRHQVEFLERAGLPVFVTFPKSVAGCVKMIADMAALTSSERSAEAILNAIETALDAARLRAPDPPVRVLCPIWRDPYMTINGDTFVDSVIRSCGGSNIFEDSAERYPEFRLEEAACRMPEVILLPTEPYHFTEDDIHVFAAMGNDIPAVRHRRIHVVEGELLSWYGPRLARALAEVSAIFHRPGPD